MRENKIRATSGKGTDVNRKQSETVQSDVFLFNAASRFDNATNNQSKDRNGTRLLSPKLLRNQLRSCHAKHDRECKARTIPSSSPLSFSLPSRIPPPSTTTKAGSFARKRGFEHRHQRNEPMENTTKQVSNENPVQSPLPEIPSEITEKDEQQNTNHTRAGIGESNNFHRATTNHSMLKKKARLSPVPSDLKPQPVPPFMYFRSAESKSNTRSIIERLLQQEYEPEPATTTTRRTREEKNVEVGGQKVDSCVGISDPSPPPIPATKAKSAEQDVLMPLDSKKVKLFEKSGTQNKTGTYNGHSNPNFWRVSFNEENNKEIPSWKRLPPQKNIWRMPFKNIKKDETDSLYVDQADSETNSSEQDSCVVPTSAEVSTVALLSNTCTNNPKKQGKKEEYSLDAATRFMAAKPDGLEKQKKEATPFCLWSKDEPHLREGLLLSQTIATADILERLHSRHKAYLYAMHISRISLAAESNCIIYCNQSNWTINTKRKCSVNHQRGVHEGKIRSYDEQRGRNNAFGKYETRENQPLLILSQEDHIRFGKQEFLGASGKNDVWGRNMETREPMANSSEERKRLDFVTDSGIVSVNTYQPRHRNNSNVLRYRDPLCGDHPEEEKKEDEMLKILQSNENNKVDSFVQSILWQDHHSMDQAFSEVKFEGYQTAEKKEVDGVPRVVLAKEQGSDSAFIQRTLTEMGKSQFDLERGVLKYLDDMLGSTRSFSMSMRDRLLESLKLDAQELQNRPSRSHTSTEFNDYVNDLFTILKTNVFPLLLVSEINRQFKTDDQTSFRFSSPEIPVYSKGLCASNGIGNQSEGKQDQKAAEENDHNTRHPIFSMFENASSEVNEKLCCNVSDNVNMAISSMESLYVMVLEWNDHVCSTGEDSYQQICDTAEQNMGKNSLQKEKNNSFYRRLGIDDTLSQNSEVILDSQTIILSTGFTILNHIASFVSPERTTQKLKLNDMMPFLEAQFAFAETFPVGMLVALKIAAKLVKSQKRRCVLSFEEVAHLKKQRCLSELLSCFPKRLPRRDQVVVSKARITCLFVYTQMFKIPFMEKYTVECQRMCRFCLFAQLTRSVSDAALTAIKILVKLETRAPLSILSLEDFVNSTITTCINELRSFVYCAKQSKPPPLLPGIMNCLTLMKALYVPLSWENSMYSEVKGCLRSHVETIDDKDVHGKQICTTVDSNSKHERRLFSLENANRPGKLECMAELLYSEIAREKKSEDSIFATHEVSTCKTTTSKDKVVKFSEEVLVSDMSHSFQERERETRILLIEQKLVQLRKQNCLEELLDRISQGSTCNESRQGLLLPAKMSLPKVNDRETFWKSRRAARHQKAKVHEFLMDSYPLATASVTFDEEVWDTGLQQGISMDAGWDELNCFDALVAEIGMGMGLLGQPHMEAKALADSDEDIARKNSSEEKGVPSEEQETDSEDEDPEETICSSEDDSKNKYQCEKHDQPLVKVGLSESEKGHVLLKNKSDNSENDGESTLQGQEFFSDDEGEHHDRRDRVEAPLSLCYSDDGETSGAYGSTNGKHANDMNSEINEDDGETSDEYEEDWSDILNSLHDGQMNQKQGLTIHSNPRNPIVRSSCSYMKKDSEDEEISSEQEEDWSAMLNSLHDGNQSSPDPTLPIHDDARNPFLSYSCSDANKDDDGDLKSCHYVSSSGYSSNGNGDSINGYRSDDNTDNNTGFFSDDSTGLFSQGNTTAISNDHTGLLSNDNTGTDADADDTTGMLSTDYSGILNEDNTGMQSADTTGMHSADKNTRFYKTGARCDPSVLRSFDTLEAILDADEEDEDEEKERDDEEDDSQNDDDDESAFEDQFEREELKSLSSWPSFRSGISSKRKPKMTIATSQSTDDEDDDVVSTMDSTAQLELTCTMPIPSMLRPLFHHSAPKKQRP